MPRVSPLRRTRRCHALASAHRSLNFGTLLSLALVLVCSLVCASNSPPQAYASTREMLADPDELGALLMRTDFPLE